MNKDTMPREGNPSVHRELGIVIPEYKMYSIKWRGDLYDINYDSFLTINNKVIKYSKLLQLIRDNSFIITNNYVIDSCNFKSAIYIDFMQAKENIIAPPWLTKEQRDEATRQLAIQIAACKHQRFKDLLNN